MQIEARRLAQGGNAQQQHRPGPGSLQPAVQEQAQRQQKEHAEHGGGKSAKAGIGAGLFIDHHAVREIEGRNRVLRALLHGEGEGFPAPVRGQRHIQIARARRKPLKGRAVQPQLRRRVQLPDFQNRARTLRWFREGVLQRQRARIEIQPVQPRRAGYSRWRQAGGLLPGDCLRCQQP